MYDMIFLSCAVKTNFLQKNLLLSLLLLSCLVFSCKSKKNISAKTTKKEKSEWTGITVKKVLRNEIDEWLGTPYKYGGTTKKGVDCSGLVNAVYLAVYDVKLPRTSKDIYAFCKHIKMEDLQEGDLIFFNYNGKGISHVGIYLDNGKYVHASSQKGVMISDIHSAYVKKYIVGAGRVKK